MEVRKKALLLKSLASSDDKNDAYVDALSDIKVAAVCVPVLDFSFVHLDELWRALSKPDDYSGLILTSPRVVQSVARAVQRTGSDGGMPWQSLVNDWCCKNVFVIGEATAATAERLGFVTVGSDCGNAETLGPLIVEQLKATRKPVLFPGGNLRLEVLPKHLKEHNIPYHSIITYETVKHPEITKNIREACSDVLPDYIVFYSPSGVSFTLPVLEELGIDIHRIKCIAIGPTTSKSVEELTGHPPAATARKPTPSELKSAILSISDV